MAMSIKDRLTEDMKAALRAGEKDPGQVGLDQLYLVDRMTVSSGLEQRIRQQWQNLYLGEHPALIKNPDTPWCYRHIPNWSHAAVLCG